MLTNDPREGTMTRLTSRKQSHRYSTDTYTTADLHADAVFAVLDGSAKSCDLYAAQLAQTAKHDAYLAEVARAFAAEVA
jgi:hypothetical protein